MQRTIGAMTTTHSPSEQIVDEVTSWPGMTAAHGTRGELSFRLGRREIGHLHGDHAAHFGFPKDVWQRAARAGPHRARTRCSPISPAGRRGASPARTTSAT